MDLSRLFRSVMFQTFMVPELCLCSLFPDPSLHERLQAVIAGTATGSRSLRHHDRLLLTQWTSWNSMWSDPGVMLCSQVTAFPKCCSSALNSHQEIDHRNSQWDAYFSYCMFEAIIWRSQSPRACGYNLKLLVLFNQQPKTQRYSVHDYMKHKISK